MQCLVVDDADDIRLLIRHVLVQQGIDVVEAATGPDALQLLADGCRPDVVVLDVQMPAMDGWATLAALRRGPATVDVPVVLCTVKASQADVDRAWELGCDGYLVKPFDIRDLVKQVLEVAGRTPEERRARRLEEQANVRRRGANGGT